MWRSVAAVVFGYVVTGILIFGTDKIFSFIIPNFNQMHELPTSYFGVSLATDAMYSALGGWTCAAIARINVEKHVEKHVLALIVLGELVGLAATIVNWAIIPHYFSLGLMILYPPAVWIGGRLRK